jgi:hypothetical protein
MLTAQIALISTLLGLTWHLLIKRGGVLQSITQWANTSNANKTLSTLIGCPYCVAGQLSLFTSIILGFISRDWSVLLSVPIAINVTFLIFVNFYKGID